MQQLKMLWAVPWNQSINPKSSIVTFTSHYIGKLSHAWETNKDEYVCVSSESLSLGGQLVHATIEDAMSCCMKPSIDPKSSVMTSHHATPGNCLMHERPTKLNLFVYQVRVYPVDIESLNLPILLKTTINFMVLQSNGRIALLKWFIQLIDMESGANGWTIWMAWRRSTWIWQTKR
jgi:hypothetical protein